MLQRPVRRSSPCAGLALRAWIMHLAAAGSPHTDIAERSEAAHTMVIDWRDR